MQVFKGVLQVAAFQDVLKFAIVTAVSCCCLIGPSQGPRSKVHRRHNTRSPLDAMCKSSLPAAKPRLRLRCKTSITQKAAPRPAGKTRRSPTMRALAIKQYLVPKARKAFALFLMENTQVKKGALKKEHVEDMKRVAKLWKNFPEAAKATYNEKSAQEFQAQRDALMRLGLDPRPQAGKATCKAAGLPLQTLEEEVKNVKKFTVGPYTVADKEGIPLLGSGSYGKVFSAYTSMGRSCAIKVYRSRDAKSEAAYEATIYKNLDNLQPSHRNWFPQMLAFDAGGQPWPWLSLACAGVSLASWLGANGAMTSELIQPLVRQLPAAIQTLHCQARLLHLDIKPANILWCSELKELKLRDFGMSEPVRASIAQGPKPTVQGPGSTIQPAKAKRQLQQLVDPLQSLPEATAQAHAQALSRFCEYVTAQYRPPELWHVGAHSHALEAALTKAVDVWSFGCVVFEISTGKVLMRARNGRQTSSRQTVADWCKHWPKMSASPYHHRQGPEDTNSSRYFRARLAASGMWHAVILAACSPEPRARRWMTSAEAASKRSK